MSPAVLLNTVLLGVALGVWALASSWVLGGAIGAWLAVRRRRFEATPVSVTKPPGSERLRAGAGARSLGGALVASWAWWVLADRLDGATRLSVLLLVGLLWLTAWWALGVAHSLSLVRPDVVEATRVMGASDWQLLWRVLRVEAAADLRRLQRRWCWLALSLALLPAGWALLMLLAPRLV